MGRCRNYWLKGHKTRTAIGARERTWHRCPKCNQFGVYVTNVKPYKVMRDGRETTVRRTYECEHCACHWT